MTSVSGSWTVPSVQGSNGYSSVWVGIDGYGNQTVEQVGTEQEIVNGSPVYYAWYEMYSTGAQQPEQIIRPMTISPGDSITAQVQYLSAGPNAGQFQLSITDTSRANDSFTTFQTSAQTQNPLAQRNCAEWIVEAPTTNGSIDPLVNFGAVAFSNCQATINNTSGPIIAPGWQSYQVNIVSGGIAQDSTSNLVNQGNASSFTVSYGSASGSVSNAAALAGPASSPTEVSTILAVANASLAPALESEPAVAYSNVDGLLQKFDFDAPTAQFTRRNRT